MCDARFSALDQARIGESVEHALRVEVAHDGLARDRASRDDDHQSLGVIDREGNRHRREL
jgi:hypothetical protein